MILLMKHVVEYSRNYANIDMTSFNTTNILYKIVVCPLVSLTSLEKKKKKREKESILIYLQGNTKLFFITREDNKGK